MAGFGAVLLKCGEQPRYFNFGRPDSPILTLVAAGAINSQPMVKDGLYSSFQAVLATGVATVLTSAIQGTNDPNTGQGFAAANNLAPGLSISITGGSTAVTSAGQFTSGMAGASVVAPGVPYGTTFTYTTPSAGALSANATLTNGAAQAQFFAQNWVATALGAITLNTSVNASDGFQSVSSWRWVRVTITTLTGAITGLQFIAGS